jgi:hypothetical protein
MSPGPLAENVKQLALKTAASLKGATKRMFMARTTMELLSGKSSHAERELGWTRRTVQKGLHELRTGIVCADGRKYVTGNKPAAVRWPTLQEDIKAVCDGQSQADPSFRTHRLYTRMSARAVREALLTAKGYAPETAPCEETVRLQLNRLGYHPVRVQKSRPLKKSPKQTPSSPT